MTQSLNLNSRDELVDKTVPKVIRSIERLGLEEGVSEQQALEELRKIMGKNKVFTSFIGKGYYDTYTPLVILRNMIENPAWYTPYTPYQAEIAQGRLEMLLNYQTMVADITGLPVANASLLDEGTAAAEALMMLWGRGQAKTVLIDSNVFTQTIDVVQTRAKGFGWNVVVLPTAEIEANLENKDVFAIVVQYPGANGELQDFTDLFAKAKANDVKIAVASDLMALTLLKTPGEMGADACFGSSQRFGVPMGYGGPHAAFLATTEAFKRKMPGRIIGVSKDSRGKPALRLAMQAREQHIRREKASSNICTAQALLANVAAAYGVYHGPDGLKGIANRIHAHAVAFAKAISSSSTVQVVTKNFFDTVAIRFPDNKEAARQAVVKAALAREMNVYVSPYAPELHVSFDETTDAKKLQALVDAFAEGLDEKLPEVKVVETTEYLPSGHLRTSEFMTHPVFNSYRSETEMLRYLYHLQQKDLSLATAMIPLGSCTMKLNSTSEMIPITWPTVNRLHPFIPADQAEGYKQMLQDLASWLCTITGFDACSLQPNSGAQGEYAGLLAIKGYHQAIGQGHRNVCLIPSSAHGTNPASAAMAGLDIVVVKCDDHGNVDIADLEAKASANKDKLAAIQLTYPSTHGVFEEAVREVCNIVHKYGGLVYLDGANMNAQVGLTSPGDIGADVCHLNLHKTFCIPHGGGGPGMGPICVRAHLAPFLPGHVFIGDKSATVGVRPQASALVKDFVPSTFKPTVPVNNKIPGAVASAPYSSASILPISWMYIRLMGATGLKESTRMAILNANYMMNRLKDHYPVLFTGTNGFCAHEFILDIRPIKAATGITEEDIAKRLMDYNFHAPTMSFPVPGTLMIEPTESESKYELDRFCDAMISIRKEIADVESGKADKKNNVLKNAPHTADMCLSDSWSFPYPREYAAYPLPYLRERKYWPTVGRLDNVYGDRNVVCTCPPIESYQQ